MTITFTEIESQAIRCARLARTLSTWEDARIALALAIDLLNEWEKTQPHPHSDNPTNPPSIDPDWWCPFGHETYRDDCWGCIY